MTTSAETVIDELMSTECARNKKGLAPETQRRQQETRTSEPERKSIKRKTKMPDRDWKQNLGRTLQIWIKHKGKNEGNNRDTQIDFSIENKIILHPKYRGHLSLSLI
jgi:hypothetical protein